MVLATNTVIATQMSLKLYSVLPNNNQAQVSFYDPGVGTFSLPGVFTKPAKAVTKALGLAFGLGITRNIADAYQFLMRTYEEGDKVFLFGFSRGAYTVRAVAAMLFKCGLLDTRDDNLIPYAMKMFKYERRPWIYNGFRQTFSRDCPVHFLGIWDTVKSVGWTYDALTLQFTMENPAVRIVRHAISIDERRCFFRQNLWGKPEKNQDVKQLWFAGVHCDVGGSYPEQGSGLSQISIRWMIDEARSCDLMIDENQYRTVVPQTEQPNDKGYHAAPSYTGVIHESLKGLWWIPEFLPRIYHDPRDNYKRKLMIPLGRRRWIPEDALVHESVLKRMKDAKIGYHPANIPRKYLGS